MSISNIASNSYNTTNSYNQLSSGKRINSASDDAAGLSIANKMLSQENGLSVGANNAKTGNDVTKIADGALDGINNSLQRIHELSLKASNGLMTQGDKEAIQGEIDGLLDNIKSISNGTEFNTMKLLDGSMASMDIAANPSGGGPSIQMQNSTLESLGIDGYDVTGDFDINRITAAMDKVNASRSSMGAASNGLESTYNVNNNSNINTTAARSTIEDLEYMSALSNFQKNKVLDSFNVMLQNRQQREESDKNQRLFGVMV